MKHPLRIVLLTALLLTACGGSGSSTAVTCASYWFDSVGACIPDGWRVLDRAALDDRGAPEDTVVAFQRNDAISGQYPTVTVTREPLTGVIDSTAYGEATKRSVSVLPGYKELDKRKVTIDGESLLIHVFLAQPVKDEPQRRFSQVSVVHGNIGYAMTALTPVSVNSTVESEVTRILQSITFEAPTQSSAAEQ